MPARSPARPAETGPATPPVRPRATKPLGRPRAFDREAALERALIAFWEHGYEATSIAELCKVMGINPPSLYAAFGDKRALFMAAVGRYQLSYGIFTFRALFEAATARAGVLRMLREAAVAYTEPGHPAGCLIFSAAINCGPGSTEVEQDLREFRKASTHALEQKIASDIRAGELPPETDARALGTFYSATLQGMSQQARDGARREDLEQIAALAMLAWPPPGPGRRPQGGLGRLFTRQSRT